MRLTTLYSEPDKFQDTIELIEREFQYSKDFRFEVDFAPLVQKENYKNLHILVDGDEVIGHTGVLFKTITVNSNEYKVGFIGGVVIKSTHQSKGYSKQLLEAACTDKDLCFYLLWSDKTDYYKKFQFHPCIQQYQFEQSLCHNSYEKVDINNLDLSIISTLYNEASEYRVNRTEKDWQNIKKIESTDLYIKKENGKITNYFFINKGQDLTDIIHEYHRPDKEMLNYGYLWTPTEIEGLAPVHQYAALLKINNNESFKQFIRNITENQIKIINLDLFQVEFEFNKQTYQQPLEEFLNGVLGPSKYEELKDLKNLYISGLDSI